MTDTTLHFTVTMRTERLQGRNEFEIVGDPEHLLGFVRGITPFYAQVAKIEERDEHASCTMQASVDGAPVKGDRALIVLDNVAFILRAQGGDVG